MGDRACAVSRLAALANRRNAVISDIRPQVYQLASFTHAENRATPFARVVWRLPRQCGRTNARFRRYVRFGAQKAAAMPQGLTETAAAEDRGRADLQCASAPQLTRNPQAPDFKSNWPRDRHSPFFNVAFLALSPVPQNSHYV
jgi:hypothetical protein